MLQQVRIKQTSTYQILFDQINQQQLTFTEAMHNLTDLDIEYQNQDHINKMVKRGCFPKNKSLKDFDFQPAINRQEILGFQDLAFIEK